MYIYHTFDIYVKIHEPHSHGSVETGYLQDEFPRLPFPPLQFVPSTNVMCPLPLLMLLAFVTVK